MCLGFLTYEMRKLKQIVCKPPLRYKTLGYYNKQLQSSKVEKILGGRAEFDVECEIWDFNKQKGGRGTFQDYGIGWARTSWCNSFIWGQPSREDPPDQNQRGRRTLIDRLSQTVGWPDRPAGGLSFILKAKLFSKEIHVYRVYFVEINKNSKYGCLQRGKPHLMASSVQGWAVKSGFSQKLGSNKGHLLGEVARTYPIFIFYGNILIPWNWLLIRILSLHHSLMVMCY